MKDDKIKVTKETKDYVEMYIPDSAFEPMKLNIHGGITEAGPHISGYTNHITQIALALMKEGIDVGIESSVQEEHFKYLDPKIIEALKKDYSEEITLSITRPETWARKLSDRPKKFFGYLVFEGSQIPFSWKHVLKEYEDQIDGIFVPSLHVKRAIASSGYHGKIPIHIVPEGVNTKVYKPIAKPAKEDIEFLYVGGWSQGVNDRKGLDIALKAYFEEFKVEEKVLFSVKVNTAYASKEKIIKDLNDLGFEFNNPNLPTVRFNFEVVPDYDQAKLYNTADVFVLPTKAEGFGLTIAEAMACGLPVIATDYGGHTDFLDEKVGYPIKISKMIKATDTFVIYEDTMWAMPNIKHLKELMRNALQNKKEYKEKGKKAAKKMKKFSWKNSAKEIIKLCFQ